MKKLLLLTCTVLFFASCMTENKAAGWLKRHGKLAALCSNEYPPADSMGDIFFVPAEVTPNGPYFVPEFDSLERQSKQLSALLEQKRRQADSISNECADVVLSFMRQVDNLQQTISRLKSEYNPPKDTVRGIQPHYNLNPPALADCQLKLRSAEDKVSNLQGQLHACNRMMTIVTVIAIALFIILCFIVVFKFIK